MDAENEMTSIPQKKNEMTLCDPEFPDTNFTETITKDTHINRKSLHQSSQNPKYMIYTDPKSNNIFVLKRKNLRIASKYF